MDDSAIVRRAMGKMSGIEELLTLGDRYRRTGDLARAEAVYRRAVQVDAGRADAWDRLGYVGLRLGRPAEAAACLERACGLRPEFADARFHLSVALDELGRLDDAIESGRRAVQLDGEHALAHNHLGALLARRGRLAEAIAGFRRAASLQPGFAAAHANLGLALSEAGQFGEALACCERAVAIDPANPVALNSLGVVQRRLGRHEGAADSFRGVLALAPDHAAALTNLGASLGELGRLDEALACCGRAVSLNPSSSQALNNLGVAQRRLGRHEEASVSFARAISLRPDYAEAHNNLAMSRLLLGDFARGWSEYEWRWKVQTVIHGSRPAADPRWDGSPLPGGTILLGAEQGLGDTIQFVRYAPLVKDRGATVVLECPGELTSLLGRSPGVDRVIPIGSPRPRYDVYAPLLSLPLLMETDLRSIPGGVPYLAPDPERSSCWKRELDARPGFKVGIVWRGNARHREDRRRSAALSQFAGLAGIEGVQLVSLQKGGGRDELPAFATRFPIADLGDRLGDFLETAAVMANLDLVVTVDSAPAHLAGALGVPVWLALPFVPDWRWLLHRSDTPWYPTMRLFRQEEPDGWDAVFEAMSRELRARIAASA